MNRCISDELMNNLGWLKKSWNDKIIKILNSESNQFNHRKCGKTPGVAAEFLPRFPNEVHVGGSVQPANSAKQRHTQLGCSQLSKTEPPSQLNAFQVESCKSNDFKSECSAGKSLEP